MKEFIITGWKYSRYCLLAILPLGIFGLVMGARMLGALQASGDDALIVPVLFYIFAIILKGWSAFMAGHRQSAICRIGFCTGLE